jgi:hypothetical protein
MKSMKYNLTIILLFFSLNLAHAQCSSNLALLLNHKETGTMAAFAKNHPVEVITRYQTFDGKISCIYEDAVEVNESVVPIADIEVIISEKVAFKARNAAAWPLKLTGFGLGIVGAIMVGGSLDFAENDYSATPLLVGLGSLGLGALLAFSGNKLEADDNPEDHTIYSFKVWEPIVLPKNVAKQKVRDSK